MQGFGDEDGARDAEVGFAGDEAGAAQVGGHADALEHRGERDEGFRVRVGEAVRAGGDGGGAGGHEGRGEQLDVLLLVVGDVLEVVVVRGAEAGLGEVRLGHFGHGAFVEDILEMFQRQGVLEDVDVGDGGLTFERAGDGGDGQQRRRRRGGSGELHALYG